MGSIFGLAKKGFGMLKKGKKGIDLKKRREVFKKASEKADYDQTVKKAKRLISEGEAAIKKRLMSPHPLTPISKGKKWVGRINPDGTHVRPKKRVGGIMRAFKKANKLKGVHGGKGMVALGAGAAGSAWWTGKEIKKLQKDIEKSGGLEAHWKKLRRRKTKKPKEK